MPRRLPPAVTVHSAGSPIRSDAPTAKGPAEPGASADARAAGTRSRQVHTVARESIGCGLHCVRHHGRMPRTTQSGSRFVSPIPRRLEAESWLRVSDQPGRVVRTEPLPAGTDCTNVCGLRTRTLRARAGRWASLRWGSGRLWRSKARGGGDYRQMLPVFPSIIVIFPASALQRMVQTSLHTSS